MLDRKRHYHPVKHPKGWIDLDNLQPGHKFTFGPGGKATIEVIKISTFYGSFVVLLNGRTTLKLNRHALYALVNGANMLDE